MKPRVGLRYPLHRLTSVTRPPEVFTKRADRLEVQAQDVEVGDAFAVGALSGTTFSRTGG
jgi:hypothetical protein